MPLEFDIKLESKDMFRFNMYQTYSGFTGLSSIVFAVIMFWLTVYTYGQVPTINTVMYIGIGILLLIYIPVTLWMRAKQTLKASPVLGNTLHYAVDADGFTVTQGEASGVLAWKQIYKMVATKHLVLVYSNRLNAYVIPKRQLGEQYVPLAKLAREKLPKYRFRMKVTIKDV